MTTGFEMDATFISKDPDVLAPSADISYPPSPTFQNLDLPTEILNINTVNKEVPQEIQHIRILSTSIEESRQFIPFIYSYRSLFRATMTAEEIQPTLKILDQKDKVGDPEYVKANEFKTKLLNSFKNHFRPTYDRLIDLQNACKRYAQSISSILETDAYQPTDVIFEKLVSLFSIIFNIDHLKSVKTGFTIDLSNYKRCFQPEEIVKDEQLQLLPIFLSTPNVTLTYLKESLLGKGDKKSKALGFLTKLLEYCVRMYKNDVLTPEQKSSLLLTMCSVLFFHSTKDQSMNIFNTSIMSSIFEILAENPVVPLYGENSFVPGYDIIKAEGYSNNTKFQLATTSNEILNNSKTLLIKYLMPRFRDLYRDNLHYASEMSRKGEVTQEGLMSLLSCLSEMTFAIQRQSALKFICNCKRPDEATEAKTGQKELKYDLAVKYNYDASDLNALVELIGYIKTLAATTIQAEPAIQQYANSTIYKTVQEYIQNTIERPLVRSRQTQQDDCTRLLEAIRDLFGNWRGINPNAELPSKTKMIRRHEIDPGIIPVTAHQLDILRVQLASIIQPDSAFTKSISVFTFSHFRPKHVNQTKAFLEACRPWYHLLNYVSVIKESTNLSFLWLRETSLDMDKVLQFPVRSSLPFILAEHVLKASDKPALHDSTFFPFELYNDAATSAIYVFRSQYLYREVEAEVALCVDMIAFTFAETFYKFCRVTSSAMELPPECIGRITPPPMRYSVMVQQNKMQLLGTPIDFNQITTTKLNTKLRKELESYIEMFTDIRMAPYIAHLVRVARTSHALLCDNHLLMDDFDLLWQQARLFDSPLCLESRLSSQISAILDFPHLSLNCVSRRFLAPKSLTLTPISKEPWASIYSGIHQHEMEYIGVEHIRAIIELLSPGELSFIVHRLSERVEDQIEKIIEIYTAVAAAIRLLPAISKDDIVGYFSFNSDAYSSVSHPKLKSLFDGMRALGNTIVFLWYLENELPVSEKSNSIIVPVMKTLCNELIKNRELFFSDSSLDLESVLSHRSFPSLWSVLEFVICSPDDSNKLLEGKVKQSPLEFYGDSPVIAAHIFITLCNQGALYKFDSMCFRTLELNQAEASNIPNEVLSRFLFNAAIAEQCRKFAELIATPFQVQFGN